MAHPADKAVRLVAEEQAFDRAACGFGAAVFPAVGAGNMPAKLLRNELNAIADAQNWNSELIERGVDPGSVLDVDAVRPAGKDDADRVLLLDFLDGNGIGLDLAVNAALAHPTCDEMVILSAKVDDQYQLMVLHKLLPYQTNPVITLFCHQFRQKATT